MPEHAEAVLFDLDGTLLDTAPDFVATVNQLLARHGKAGLAENIIRQNVSNGASALVTLAFQYSPNDPGFDALREELLTLYESLLGTATTAFSGIEPLLSYLHEEGIAWGIVTNKPERYTTPLLEKLNFQPPSKVVICPDHVSQTKPHPEPLLLAASQLHCKPAHCVYVGDHLRDIEAGTAAGMTTIAAAFGYVSNPQEALTWQADYCVESAYEIKDVLTSCRDR